MFAHTLLTAKKALDSINQSFVLACGTSLGYYRGQKFIEHDPDIDIFIFRKDYHIKLRKVMERRGFKYLHQYGKLDNGLEMSFRLPKKKEKSYPKLDIFFMYEEPDYYWRSGYEAKSWSEVDSGREIPQQLCVKYTKFEIISVNFLGQPFLVPDISYIEQLYGKEWRTLNKKFKHFNVILPPDLKDQLFCTVDNSWMTEVTVGVKTFLRPECLVNCIKSVRLYYPNISIIIADDSDDKIKKVNQKNMKKFKVKIIDLPFDSGLSVGRNTIVNQTTSKYIVIIDDDTIVTEMTDLEKMYQFLVETDYDIIGGYHQGRDPYVAQFCQFDQNGLVLKKT